MHKSTTTIEFCGHLFYSMVTAMIVPTDLFSRKKNMICNIILNATKCKSKMLALFDELAFISDREEIYLYTYTLVHTTYIEREERENKGMNKHTQIKDDREESRVMMIIPYPR